MHWKYGILFKLSAWCSLNLLSALPVTHPAPSLLWAPCVRLRIVAGKCFINNKRWERRTEPRHLLWHDPHKMGTKVSIWCYIFYKQILNLYNISLARLIELSAVKTDWYCGVNIRRDFHKNDGSSCSEKWMGPCWDPGKQWLTFGFITLSVVVWV